jgi:hypothetical protein
LFRITLKFKQEMVKDKHAKMLLQEFLLTIIY